MTTTQTAAPTSAFMSASTLLLALVVAFELYGANALSQGHGRWITAAADGSTIYTSTTANDERVVAQATIAAN
jgi:hypothetical protein